MDEPLGAGFWIEKATATQVILVYDLTDPDVVDERCDVHVLGFNSLPLLAPMPRLTFKECIELAEMSNRVYRKLMDQAVAPDVVIEPQLLGELPPELQQDGMTTFNRVPVVWVKCLDDDTPIPEYGEPTEKERTDDA